MGVWLPQCGSHVIVHYQVLLVCFVCEEDVGWHPCSLGQLKDERSHYLVETLINVYAGSCDVCSSKSLDFEIHFGVVYHASSAPAPGTPANMARSCHVVIQGIRFCILTEPQTRYRIEVIFKIL